jgi:hypothetical protein
MTRFEYINENFERIKNDIANCITPACVIKHFAVYGRYEYYRKQGYNKTTAALYAGDDYKISDKQVFRIINQMETKI